MPTSAILAIAASRDKQVNVAVDHALKVREPRLVQCSNHVRRRGSIAGLPSLWRASPLDPRQQTVPLQRRSRLPCANCSWMRRGLVAPIDTGSGLSCERSYGKRYERDILATRTEPIADRR